MAAPLPTYYDILQVERDAPPEHIRMAWRRLAQKYHPDRNDGDAQASRAMAAINAAYEVLSDGAQRAAHDDWIAASRKPRAGRPRRIEFQTFAAFIHPSNSWPWLLLFGTMAFALATIGTAMYMTAMPARAQAAPAPASVQKQPAAVPVKSPALAGKALSST